MTAGEMLWWLPTAATAGMTALGVAALAAQPWHPARKHAIAVLLVVGVLAISLSAWQQAKSHAELGGEAARLRQLGKRLDDVGRLLPAGPGANSDETFDTVAAAIVSLNAKIKDLEGQIETLREKSRTRSIEPEIAEKLTDYLRQAGPHRVVVSCLPDDLEAYTYANQLANVLRLAGWEALGPEKTTIFGEAPAIGIRLYVRSTATAPPDTGKLLTDAFTRFNIPYQSGITPSDAIPDPATIELFVGPKP
jgi:outer membrane murein-binding lipoprotein Lpp